MRCEKNDFVVRDPEKGGFPSTYWVGDKYRCPVCGQEVVVGFCSKGHLPETAQQHGWVDRDFEAGKEALEFVYNPEDVKQ
jgi:hypothetical protein